MDITTKGHIENINNNKITTNSWDGRWNEAQGTGSIATINTNKNGNEPTNVVENYKPIADVKELNPYMNNDPRMDHYFALRTIPRKETETAQEVHDDTYTPKNTSALVDKLESLLNKEPKVLVFKPQPHTPLSPSRRSSSPSRRSSSPSRRSSSPSRSRSSSSPSRSSSSSSPSRSSSSSSPSRSRSSSRSSKSKSRERQRSNTHYATPKRKTSNVQTRKKKTPTPKKKKTPTPKKKNTFIPPTVSLRNAVKAITP